MASDTERELRPGDLVEVRSAVEILATLDESGALESVPFMPEMLQHVGRRFIVSQRVEKICDTVTSTGSRRMRNTVFLEDLRCDGSGHGGCQAGCRIYWKEAWLTRVDSIDAETGARDNSMHVLAEVTSIAARPPGLAEGHWRCQATEALNATERLRTSDLRQYWRELRARNVGLGRFVRVAVPGFFTELFLRMGLTHQLPLRGSYCAGDRTHSQALGPGDLVQIRTKAEIAKTLDAGGYNQGLSFDPEMLPHCGETYRVKDRVERIIDERTGRMLKISADCLILDGVTCSGEHSVSRWFCPRAVYPFWREAWLRPVDSPEASESG